MRPNQISEPTILTASLSYFSEKFFLKNEYQPTSIVRQNGNVDSYYSLVWLISQIKNKFPALRYPENNRILAAVLNRNRHSYGIF